MGRTHLKGSKRVFQGQKNLFCQKTSEIEKKGHFSHQKNQSFQNLGSDCEKRHFLVPPKRFLAFFGHFLAISMPFSVLGPIENNFFTKFHVGHKNGMPTATFKFSHFFVLILTVFPKNLVSPNLGQNSETMPFLISKNSERSTSGFRF